MATTATFSTFSRRTPAVPALHDRLLRYFGGTDTRRELQRLSASQLHDIGLDPAQVSREPACQIDPRTMINLMSMR